MDANAHKTRLASPRLALPCPLNLGSGHAQCRWRFGSCTPGFAAQYGIALGPGPCTQPLRKTILTLLRNACRGHHLEHLVCQRRPGKPSSLLDTSRRPWVALPAWASLVQPAASRLSFPRSHPRGACDHGRETAIAPSTFSDMDQPPDCHFEPVCCPPRTLLRPFCTMTCHATRYPGQSPLLHRPSAHHGSTRTLLTGWRRSHATRGKIRPSRTSSPASQKRRGPTPRPS